MISQWTVVSVFNKIFNFFVSHLFVIYFLSFQLFVFSALWSSQPFELPSFLVSKLFGPPKMSLVLQPPVAWLLILRTGMDSFYQWAFFTTKVGHIVQERSLGEKMPHIVVIHWRNWFDGKIQELVSKKSLALFEQMTVLLTIFIPPYYSTIVGSICVKLWLHA